MKRGRQREATHTSAAAIVVTVSCWRMIAQAPKPLSAVTMPTAPPHTVAPMSRSSSERKFISRMSSEAWVAASEPMKKPSESTANRPWTSGSP